MTGQTLNAEVYLLKTRGGHCRLPNEIGSLSVFTGAVTAL
jgi:hypothetical protein